MEAIRRSSLTAKEVKLDEKQQKLSDLSARYMLMFAVSMGSTLLFMILSNAVGAGIDSPATDAWAYALIVPDFVVNLLCLYLQYGFARDDFNRCCGFLDRRCKKSVAKKTKKTIEKHSQELMSGMEIQSGMHAVDSSSMQSPTSTTSGSERTQTKENTVNSDTEAVSVSAS